MTRRLGRTRLLLATAVLLSPACTSGSGEDTLPARELSVLGSNESTTIAALAQGRPAVVNVWASWCEPCVVEMPALQDAHEQLGEAVAFVGVAREDRVVDALALADETGVDYMLLEDPDGSWFRTTRSLGMPTTLLVDSDGNIRHRHSGPVTTAMLLALVATHLGVET